MLSVSPAYIAVKKQTQSKGGAILDNLQKILTNPWQLF